VREPGAATDVDQTTYCVRYPSRAVWISPFTAQGPAHALHTGEAAICGTAETGLRVSSRDLSMSVNSEFRFYGSSSLVHTMSVPKAEATQDIRVRVLYWGDAQHKVNLSDGVGRHGRISSIGINKRVNCATRGGNCRCALDCQIQRLLPAESYGSSAREREAPLPSDLNRILAHDEVRSPLQRRCCWLLASV